MSEDYNRESLVQLIKALNSNLRILQVLDHYDIEYTEKMSGRYDALCPFHNDTSPSLQIYTENESGEDSWCCYVCNINGDCFRFIRLMSDDHKSAVRVARDIIKGANNKPIANQRIKEIQRRRMQSKKVMILWRRLGVQYREWLQSLKSTSKYEMACDRVEEILHFLEDLWEKASKSGDYSEIRAYIEEREERLERIMEK